MKSLISFIFLLFIISCSQNQLKRTSYRDFFSRSAFDPESIDSNERQKKAIEHFILGSSLVQQEKLSESVIEFQQSLRYDTTAATYFALSEAYFKLGKNDLALDYILLSIDLNPDFVQQYELLTEIFMVKNEIDNAISSAEMLNKKEPSTSNKLFLAHLLERKEPKKAIDLYEEIYDSNHNTIILLRLTELYRKTNDNESLERILSNAFSENSSNIDYFEELFSLYIQQQNYKKAFQFLKIASNNFLLDQMRSRYAILLQYMIDDKEFKDTTLAYDFINHVQKKFFYFWKMVYGTSFLAQKFEMTELVDELFGHVLMIYDSDPKVPLFIGSHYALNKNYTRSNEILIEESKNFPDNSDFPLILSQNYQELGKKDSAKYYTQKALDISPNNSEIMAQLAYFYENDGEFNISDSLYSKSIELNPNNIVSLNNYSYSLATRNIRLDDCIKMIEKVISIDSSRATFLDTYAFILYKHKEYEKALIYIKKAIEKDSTNAEVYEHLGDIQLKLKDFEGARAAYRRSLEIVPGRMLIYEKIKSIR